MGQGGDAPRTALTLCSPSPVFLFQVPPIEESFDDNKHSLKPWDTKKVGAGPLPPGGGAVGKPPPLRPLPLPASCRGALRHRGPQSASCPQTTAGPGWGSGA